MTQLVELGARELRQRLKRGLLLVSGPFLIRIFSTDARFATDLQRLYAFHEIRDGNSPGDLQLRITPPNSLRRWLRPQIKVYSSADQLPPFAPFPRSQGFALFEWALNWTLAITAHQYLMLHSAVLERDGKALLMPGLPGAGKSTLCAALMLRGWRLLSDEFGLLDPNTELLHPLPRPIPLKNQSIQVIRDFDTTAVLGPTYPGTRKGDVAHVRPSETSVLRNGEPAKPTWFVFPRYQPEADTTLTPFADGQTFLKVTGNAFNYRLLGGLGFRKSINLVRNTDSFSLIYSDLNDAISTLESSLPGL